MALLLSTALVLALPVALAADDLDDDELPYRFPVASEEITVEAERLFLARYALARALEDLGYTPHRRGDAVRWTAPWKDRWKPRVLIRDDGRMEFISPSVVFQGVKVSVLDPTAFLPQDALRPSLPSGANEGAAVIIGARFWITERRKLDAQESRLSLVLGPLMSDLRDAISMDATSTRLLTLPDELEVLWLTGTDPRGTVFPTPEARRAELLRLWETRTDTPEGKLVRQTIGAFMAGVVQRSSSPFTSEELAGVEARCGCEVLPGGGWGAP